VSSIDTLLVRIPITFVIVEELIDEENRHRLWQIYLSGRHTTKDQLMRTDALRLRQLEKRLAIIRRNHRLTQDTLFPIASRHADHLSMDISFAPSLGQNGVKRWNRSSK
jgi:hypothetical protein